ncbi:MAG: ATP-binding cassette domain-containing protein, partial [Candidatus Thorarchaeota archaeon]
RVKRINEISSAFDLTSIINQKSYTLSGGELRRVNLACNLVYEPSVLLCDEPTGHLDKENKLSVLKYIKNITGYSESVIIVATHDKSLIGNYPTFEIKQRRVQKCQ